MGMRTMLFIGAYLDIAPNAIDYDEFEDSSLSPDFEILHDEGGNDELYCLVYLGGSSKNDVDKTIKPSTIMFVDGDNLWECNGNHVLNEDVITQCKNNLIEALQNHCSENHELNLDLLGLKIKGSTSGAASIAVDDLKTQLQQKVKFGVFLFHM